ncbi:hypothetical protein BESB_081310 [Besnoitia besnoiti]|uniref:Uncharacterized protein n=1 Tax=Besnoitia besnoiti TaxID=94643 RepID=A0A2A9MC18_BESBE|nr:hypothetical protein BESB_081310 [Besnoitia besnoiti]PFH32932.1 hypothetical protein BESB_081310 [Besnoitia besnoiti]
MLESFRGASAMPVAAFTDGAVVAAAGLSSRSASGSYRPSPARLSNPAAAALEDISHGRATGALLPRSFSTPLDSEDDALLPALAFDYRRTVSDLPLARRTKHRSAPEPFSAPLLAPASLASVDDEAAGSEATTAVGSSAPSPVGRHELRLKSSEMERAALCTLVSAAAACRHEEEGRAADGGFAASSLPLASKETDGRDLPSSPSRAYEDSHACTAPANLEAEEPFRVARPDAAAEEGQAVSYHRATGALLLPIPTRRRPFFEQDTDRNGGSASDSGLEILPRSRRTLRRASDRDGESTSHRQLAKRVSFGSPLSVEVHQYSYADGCRSSGGSAMSGSSRDSSNSSLSSLSSPPSSQSLLSQGATVEAAASSSSSSCEGAPSQRRCLSPSPSAAVDAYGRPSAFSGSGGMANVLSPRLDDLSDGETGCVTRRHKDLSASGRGLFPPSFGFFGAASSPESESSQAPAFLSPPMQAQSPPAHLTGDSASSPALHPQSPRHCALQQSALPSASPSVSSPSTRPLYSSPKRCHMHMTRSATDCGAPRCLPVASSCPFCERDRCGASPPLTLELLRTPCDTWVGADSDARKKKRETKPASSAHLETLEHTQEEDPVWLFREMRPRRLDGSEAQRSAHHNSRACISLSPVLPLDRSFPAQASRSMSFPSAAGRRQAPSEETRRISGEEEASGDPCGVQLSARSCSLPLLLPTSISQLFPSPQRAAGVQLASLDEKAAADGALRLPSCEGPSVCQAENKIEHLSAKDCGASSEFLMDLKLPCCTDSPVMM